MPIYTSTGQKLVGGLPAASWMAKDSQTNATATATQAAVAGSTHYVCGVSASFSAAVAGPILLQIKDGTTVVWENYVTTTNAPFIFAHPLPMTAGNAANAVLAAGGAAIVGKVNMSGFTE